MSTELPANAPAWFLPAITNAITAAVAPLDAKIVAMDAKIDGVVTRLDAMAIEGRAREQRESARVSSTAPSFQLCTLLV